MCSPPGRSHQNQLPKPANLLGRKWSSVSCRCAFIAWRTSEYKRRVGSCRWELPHRLLSRAAQDNGASVPYFQVRRFGVESGCRKESPPPSKISGRSKKRYDDPTDEYAFHNPDRSINRTQAFNFRFQVTLALAALPRIRFGFSPSVWALHSFSHGQLILSPTTSAGKPVLVPTGDSFSR